jgi:O-antigen ligase
MEQSLRRELTGGLAAGVVLGAAAAALPRPVSGWIALSLAVPLCWWTLAGAGRWVLLFLAAALVLPPLPLPGGDSGPHPALLFAALGLWAGLLRLPAWRIRPGWLALALVLFCGVLFMSVPLAALYSGPQIAAGSLARVGLLGISLYVFLYLAYGPGRSLEPKQLIWVLFWAGFGSGLFACLDFYFQFPAPARFAEQFVWLPGGVYRRAQGLFYEASTLATLCVFLLVMVAAVVSQKMTRRLGLRAGGLAVATVVWLAALVLSFSRAPLISLGTSLAALAWLERRRLLPLLRPHAWMAVCAGLLGGGAAAMYRLVPDFLDLYLRRLRSSGEFFLETPNLILSRRLESWTFLLEYLRDHPWRSLLGIGYKTLPYSEAAGRPVVADNMYLSLLVETGWLGLASLLLLHIAILATCYRWATRGASDLQRLAGAWMFCVWCGQTVQMASGDTLTYWRLLPAFFAVLALGVRDEDPVP